MIKNSYRNYTKLLILVFCFLIFAPSFLKGAPAQSYKWTSEDSVEDSNGMTFSLDNGEKYPHIGPSSPYNSVTHYIFKSDRLDNTNNDKWITIDKSTPDKGLLKEMGSVVWSPEKQINIIGINDPGPKPLPKISKGSIWGTIVQNPQGDWKGTTLSQVLDRGKNVYLTTDDGAVVKFGAHPKGESEIDPQTLRFSQYSINDSEYKFLYPGLYRLKYEQTEQSDCQTGSINGGGVTQLLCSVTIKGIFNFKLEDDLSDGPGGKGRIIPVNSDEIEQKSLNGDKGVLTTTMDTVPKIKMVLDYSSTTPLSSAIREAINSVLGMIETGMKKGQEAINDILIRGNDLEEQSGVKSVWVTIRNITLSLLTLGILIIGFANILQINMQSYGLNRMLPRLIIGIVLTYFSFLIAAFLLDLMSGMQTLLFPKGLGKTPFTLTGELSARINPVSTISDTGELLFLLLIGIGLFLVVIWLWLLLVVRIAMLYVLVAVAPLAFMAYILPFTEKYFKQWWASFWKWAFMGPAVAFMLWLTQKFLYNGYFSTKLTQTGATIDTWIWLIAAGVMLWLSAILPLKMGSEVYNGIKNTWGAARGGKIPGTKGISTYLDQRKGAKEAARTDRVRNFRRGLASTKIGQAPILGTAIHGANAKQRAALFEEAVSEEQKKLAPSKGNWVALHDGLKKSKKGSLEEAAYLREIGEMGAVDTKDTEVLERFAGAIEKNMPGVSASAYKLRHQLYPAMATKGIGGDNALRQAELSLRGTKPHEYTAQQGAYLSSGISKVDSKGNVIADSKALQSELINRLKDPATFQFVKSNLNQNTKDALFTALENGGPEAAKIQGDL